jgi:hypothetical protein
VRLNVQHQVLALALPYPNGTNDLVWSCPGLVDRSGLGCSVSGLVSPCVVGGGEVAEGGVPPTRVVEAFQVVEDRHTRLAVGAEAVPVQQLALTRRKPRPS